MEISNKLWSNRGGTKEGNQSFAEHRCTLLQAPDGTFPICPDLLFITVVHQTKINITILSTVKLILGSEAKHRSWLKIYRTRAIITLSLYIFYPLFEAGYDGARTVDGISNPCGLSTSCMNLICKVPRDLTNVFLPLLWT